MECAKDPELRVRALGDYLGLQLPGWVALSESLLLHVSIFLIQNWDCWLLPYLIRGLEGELSSTPDYRQQRPQNTARPETSPHLPSLWEALGGQQPGPQGYFWLQLYPFDFKIHARN